MTDTQAIKERVDLRELAGRYTTLQVETHGELKGPCPKCGGTDRFKVKQDGFFCRNCYPIDDHGWHDAIDFAKWINGVGFKEAIEALGGAISAPVRRPDVNTGTIVPKADERPVKDFSEEAEAAQDELIAGVTANARTAWAYLEKRGIDPVVALTYGLGVTRWLFDGVGIVMPWYAPDGTIPAMRVRFVEPVRDKVRSTKGSTMRGNVFGFQKLNGRKNLLIVEGEINAMSVYQASFLWLDVVSVGSQDQALRGYILDAVKRYDKVAVWLDSREKAQKRMESLGASFCLSGYVDGDGKEYDANDYLKHGILSEYLFRAYEDPEGGERVR